MSTPFDITEEQAQGLDALAALDLALAKAFAERALAESDPQVAQGHMRAYRQAARSYRQTLAFKLRVKRDLAALARTDKPKPDPAAVRERREALREALGRVVWSEHERPDWTEGDAVHADLVELDKDLLLEIEEDPDFATPDLDDHVLALGARLGHDLALLYTWRTLPPVPPPRAKAAPRPPPSRLAPPDWRDAHDSS